ncbi:hypothetical protein SAMN05216404_107104 [Nitrosospira multiformis]|uniref:PIN domain-containing protein n=1 Tax=Nitrosospira multiformis TaxID=1231 RepID=A0A1H8JKA6_9PROT|nr:hypothetical protein SAMN05216404_107104 [Nitrosospira multiformis]
MPALRDPADQLVLATLKAAQARYIITGDKDLLIQSSCSVKMMVFVQSSYILQEICYCASLQWVA